MNGEKLFGGFSVRFDDNDAAGTFKPPKYKPSKAKRGCKGSASNIATIEPDDNERYHCPHCKAKLGRGYLIERGNAAYLPQHEAQS